MTTLTISLPPETAAQLEREAQARGMSAEQWAQEALAGLLDDWAEALRALDEAGDDIDADVAFDQLDAAIAMTRAGA
jgi:predicted transcriptional regulator